MKLRHWLLHTVGVPLVAFCLGCASIQSGWDTVTVHNQPDSGEMCKAFMAPDWGVDPDLAKHRSEDAKKLKAAGINTIYIVADIQNNGPGTRPYVVAGRKERVVLDVLIENIRWIWRQGFRVLICLANEPSVRNGGSAFLDGLGRTPGLKAGDLYVAARLDNEKACWKDLIDKRGGYLWGGVLYLEPTQSSSKAFCDQLYQYIRSQGFKGPLLNNNLIGYDIAGTIYAPSLGNVNAWMKSGGQIKNADGLQGLNANTAARDIPRMVGAPGPMGYILWYDQYRGSAAGRGVLEDWMWRYIK